MTHYHSQCTGSFCGSIHVKSPSLGGTLPLFYPISLLNIHLPPRSGNIPLFEAHLLPIVFLLQKSELYWILHWKCIAKSTKYPQSTIIKCYASYKPLYGGKLSSFQNFQPEFECLWTKLMSRNGFTQNLPLWQDAKREISLFWTFPTWHVCGSPKALKRMYVYV